MKERLMTLSDAPAELGEAKLLAFLAQRPKAALAFSGGVDSAYLLFIMAKAGIDVLAIQVLSDFQPAFEARDAEAFCAELGVSFLRLTLPEHRAETMANPENRCYHCKCEMLDLMQAAARERGYDLFYDGSNASDDWGERPGAKALAEYGVVSPLRLAGLTKADIRERSKAYDLPTWDKAAYACLATRVPTGEKLSKEKLKKVEKTEAFLSSLGFYDYRARLRGKGCLLQLLPEQMPLLLAKRAEILAALGADFDFVALDLASRSEEPWLHEHKEEVQHE